MKLRDSDMFGMGGKFDCITVPRERDDVTDARSEGRIAPGKLNVKRGPQLAYISILLLFGFQ